MARVYTNENFPVPAALYLRQMGHDVLTTFDSGKSGQAIPDNDVLNYARQNDRVLITMNRRDFIRLHAEHPDHAGIIVCTVDPDFEKLAQRLHQALSAHDDHHGVLIRVNRPAG